MSQGNPNKVNAIVDEIVKNNNLFKLKSPIEQDKEKDSIAKSINSALSVLNEVGKELVLQELSVDPDEKFKGFIDSVGNVDISGLTQMTTTIVKAKIEEAEREGIDLRQGQTVFKENNKTVLMESVLTLAVIDTMVTNFKNLPYEQQKDLFNNWNLLTTSQKSIILETQANLLMDQALNESDPVKKETLEKASQNADFYSKKMKEAETYTEEQAKEANENYLFGNPDAKKTYEQCKTNNFSEKDIYKIFISHDAKIMGDATSDYFAGEMSEQEYRRLTNQQNQRIAISTFLESEEILNHFGLSKGDAKKIAQSNPKQVLKLYDMYTFFTNSYKFQNVEINLETLRDMTVEEQYELYQKYQGTNIKEASDNFESIRTISLEIEQLPSALAKANFSQEEISEALKIYVDFIKKIDDEVIDDFKTKDEKELISFVKDYFSEYKEQMTPKSFEVLENLANNTFGGQIQQILTDSQILQKTFLPALSAEIEKIEHQPIEDKQTDKYYHSQNETLKVDGNVEKIAQEVQARGGSVEEITKALADTVIKHESKPVTQTQSEMYSFIDAEYLKQDSIEGLIPRNGENSQSLQDDKKAIFYSQGKEGAIVTYFEFLKQYEILKGSAGDKVLEQYASYKNGTIELSDEQVQLLQGQLKQITQMRKTKDFDEFMGDKLYLKLNGIDMEQDRQAAEEWRASHPGTRMHYNYANSWTNNAISPDRIDVVSLQSKDGKDVRTSQKDLIKYFLSQTSIDKIEELGVNDTTLENIRKYYQEHSAEIAQMGEEYSVVTQNIQEFEQSRENSDFEKQAIEQEKDEETSQNMAMVEQDNSFIGKIKRVFANMRDMKNKDNSKGFFARLGASIQTVFGNKKEEFCTEQDEISTYTKTEDKIQPRTNPKQIDYLNQHFEVNTQEAIRKTEESKKSKEFLSTEDKTADKEEK